MSREQWGHGYWKGVKDARNGTVKDDKAIERLARFYCCHFMLSNQRKEYDRSLFSVKTFITMAKAFDGVSELLCKKVYDFIMENMPYGCYVSGCSSDPWYEDYFVLGNLNEEECLDEIDSLFAQNRQMNV